MGCRAFLAIPAAGAGFFLSAWILMIFTGILAEDLDVNRIGYVTSMIVTIAIWLVIAPVVGAIARKR